VGACGVGCLQVQIKTDTIKKTEKMRRPTNTDSEYRMEKGTMSDERVRVWVRVVWDVRPRLVRC